MSILLRNMTPIRRKCFPLFSFMHFITWLIPWPWTGDSRACSQVPGETYSPAESTILDIQTDEFMSVSKDDFKYLAREEAEQIIERFEEIPQSYDRLLFWTGIPRRWAQEWADDHGMLTFSSAMGPLMDSTDNRCLRRTKKSKQWTKYIKGACGIFARYACKRGIVRVLTLPPYWAEFIRPQSTYRNIEEPVLKGRSGRCGAVQINAVYLLTTLEELEYQIWPEDRIPERLSCRGIGSSSFKLPSWTKKAVNIAVKSLRYNDASLAASTTPKLPSISVVLQGSVKSAGDPPRVKEPKGGNGLRSNANAHGIIQSQNPQPQTKKQQPQSQEPQRRKKQPQTQQLPSKEKQPKTQQSSSKKQQPQNQQPQIQLSNSKNQQSQSSQPQTKNQQPQSQQPQRKKKQPQTQQLPSKEKQPQTQQSSSKKQQPQTQQLQSKKQQPQTQQTSSKKKHPQTQQSPSNKELPKPQQSLSKKEQPQKQQTQNQQPQSKKPQPQNNRKLQQGKQPQSSKELMIKAGA